MINFMTRHRNPLRIFAINPVEAKIHGEDQYSKDIKAATPEYILFVDIDSSRLGARYFGIDYALDIDHWIKGHYSLEKQFGATPYTGQGFGIQILKRNEHPEKGFQHQ